MESNVIENLSNYFNRLEKATSVAIDYLKSHDYMDIIGKQRYRVRTILPEGPNAFLTTLISKRSRRFYQLDYEKNTRYFTPVELLSHIVRTANGQSSTSPSSLPLNELIEQLVSEIEVLPQILELEQQGKFVEANEMSGLQ